MLGLPADYFPIEIAVGVRQSADREAFLAALEGLGSEVRVETNIESDLTIVSGKTEAGLDHVVKQLDGATEYRLNIGAPQIAYRERLGCAADVDFTHKKQSGGTGQFARVKLRFEPQEEGTGFVFEDRIANGAVPANFIPAVEKGLDMARQNGLLAGYPVIDFRAVLLDGAYHDADSTPLAFEIAARGAFRELRKSGDPRLMVPVVHADVAVPDALADTVRAIFRARGGMEVIPLVPERDALRHFHARFVNFIGLEAELAGATQGAARVAFRFAGMQDVLQTPGGGGDDRFPPAVGMRA